MRSFCMVIYRKHNEMASNRQIQMLVATDVAARGIDVDNVTRSKLSITDED